MSTHGSNKLEEDAIEPYEKLHENDHFIPNVVEAAPEEEYPPTLSEEDKYSIYEYLTYELD